MPYVSTGAVKIHFETEGAPECPALLLLNSLGTSLAMWDKQMAQLRHEFHVIRFDMRGHGQSSPTDSSECSIALLAQDALAVLQGVGVSQAHWCGVSIGAMVAMWVATHHPEFVEKLILFNTSAYLPPASMWQARSDTVRREGIAAIAQQVVLRWFSSAFRDENPQAVQRLSEMLLMSDAKSYAALCGAISTMDQRAEISSIACPTLIVGGSKDPATPLSHSQLLRDTITGSRLCELDAAHLSVVERAEESSAAIREFLRVPSTDTGTSLR